MTSKPLPAQASVVIIGGGVMGASIAYELASSGVRDVVLVDKAAFGSGSTCKAAGGVRAQFSDPLNISLGSRSLETFANFGSRFGQEIDFHRVGYLFLLKTPDEVAAFEANVALQNDLGVPTRLLEPAEAKKLSPLIATDDILAATYSPADGHCTPESVVLGYVSAARRAGATLVSNCAATGVDHDGNHIRAVHTEGGAIATDTVICAAGVWSAQVGEWVDVDLPVTPLRRQVLLTEPTPGVDPNTPFTIDFHTSYYFHREGNGLLLGMSDPDETPGFKLRPSDEWLPRLGQAIAHRTPSLVDVGVKSGWAGLYEMTPDKNALLGRAAGGPNFFYATGFSGHGFLMAPAVAEIMRDLYLEQEPFIDISGLSTDRFHGEMQRPELNIV